MPRSPCGRKAIRTIRIAFSADWLSTGLRWLEDCHGDTYDVHPSSATVYTASHAHNCVNIGGFPETTPRSFHRALAFSERRDLQFVAVFEKAARFAIGELERLGAFVRQVPAVPTVQTDPAGSGQVGRRWSGLQLH